MPLPFREHPLRRAVAAELHARTYDPLRAPARVAQLAVMLGEQGPEASIEHLQRLLETFGGPVPDTFDQHYAADVGPLRLGWERHTEFVTYTFSRQGAFDHPFAASVLDELPAQWLRTLPGETIAAVTMAIEACDAPERDADTLTALFEGNPVIGSEVVAGSARAWSDLRIHSDGFFHILIRDCSMSDNQAGRLAKRILDINCYRALALLGLPLAREVSPALSEADRRLALVASRMTTPASSSSESDLLAELTSLATEIEALTARTTYRFDAARAYYGMVQQRLEQLRQQRIEGLQTFSEFLDARLAPAIATCEATQHRQSDLAERAARLTSLLRARVEVSLQQQNRRLLESMDRRAQLQLRLQETVEGLSVMAIGYYGVGLVGYALKGLEKGGLPLDATLGMAIALPFVVGFTWFVLRRTKKRLTGSTESASRDLA
ncbi:MAG: DUF3422 domain-containing protein [Thiocapsa sp.]|nr:DUF3422 domain-containing protein [Thiocapsa sp.]MCG6983724.1 DUF3422 domain-containing protein [Thiocapsa sp.]